MLLVPGPHLVAPANRSHLICDLSASPTK